MSAPPSAAMTLLRDGHPVAKVCEWTGVSRWHLQLAITAEGLYVDADTDVVRTVPTFETGTAWRIWARSNGWPDLPDSGQLPAGLMEAYLVAHPEDRVAVSTHARAQRRDRRVA